MCRRKSLPNENGARPDRSFGPHVIRRQGDQLRRSLRSLGREGFRKVHVLRGTAEVDAAVIVRERLLTDHRDRTGPFEVTVTCMAAAPNWKPCWPGPAT